jgi:hypothetical protein
MSPERRIGEASSEPCITESMRDSLIAAYPAQADLIRARDAVLDAYCQAKGIAKDDVGIEELLEIRTLPEWQNPPSLEPPKP